MASKGKLVALVVVAVTGTAVIWLKECQLELPSYVIADLGTQDLPEFQQPIRHPPPAPAYNYTIWEQSPADTKWELIQEGRKRAVMEGCRGLDRDLMLEHLLDSPARLAHLMVDDKHRAVYCYIPKVACTTWKRVWAVMRGVAIGPTVNPHYLTTKMSLYNQKLKPQRSNLRHKLTSYTKFVVVRHPLERLVSAFRDKFESKDTRSHKAFMKNYGYKIIKKYRIKPSQIASPNLHPELKFSEFVSFILDQNDQEKANEHWRPFEHLCYPCAVNYDVIGKYESLTEDSERFLRLISAPPGLHFPSYAPTNTSGFAQAYLATLTQDQLFKLSQIYHRDYQLFQYDLLNVT